MTPKWDANCPERYKQVALGEVRPIGVDWDAYDKAVAWKTDSTRGMVLLGAYSAGLGLPFLAAAFFAGAFQRFMQRFRRHMPFVDKAMGLVLVLTGLLFTTGTINRIGFWLYEKLPWLGSIG